MLKASSKKFIDKVEALVRSYENNIKYLYWKLNYISIRDGAKIYTKYNVSNLINTADFCIDPEGQIKELSYLFSENTEEKKQYFNKYYNQYLQDESENASEKIQLFYASILLKGIIQALKKEGLYNAI